MDFTLEELKDVSVGIGTLFLLSRKAVRGSGTKEDQQRILKRERLSNLNNKLKELIERHH